MKKYWKKAFATALAIGFIAPLAWADPQDLVDDGWVTISKLDPVVLPDIIDNVTYGWGSDSIIDGSKAMYLGEQAYAWYRFADTPVFGKVEFLVYDKGVSSWQAHSTFGPRWAVMNNPVPNTIPVEIYEPDDQYMGVSMLWKSFFDGNLTYGFNNGWSTAGSVETAAHSITWPGSFDGPSTGQHADRRIAGTLATGLASGVDTPVHVQGAWSKWSIEVHDGQDYIFKVSDPDGSNPQEWTVIPQLDSVFDTGFSSTGFNQLYFHGGNAHDLGTPEVGGVWIDQIVFTADPNQGVSDFSFDFEDVSDPCPQRGSEGDFNCDTEIGLLDLDILGTNWGTTGLDPATSYTLGDASGDGEVGLLDLDTLGQNWGLGTSIPEPATLGLLAISSLLAVRRR